MPDDVVIRAEGLGKKYVIGHEVERERYTALRDVMARSARSQWRKTADMARGRAIVSGDATEELWALKDVSFEVKRGEVLGIIGRNGAGKSTLLKILSRITEPTEGRVTIRGRVASLLEVGTGFHPELTGRENIYLNGAILGMTRAEIKRKFDEIIAFADVERFLDTPVKRYSSGMYVRLAFALAAHLEPEILVIDEVLAVGDAEFQKKCLGKMSEVAGSGGRTVLFVSHHLGLIAQLCESALLLSKGRMVLIGKVREAIDRYVSDSAKGAGEVLVRDEALKGLPAALLYVDTFSKDGVAASHFTWDEPIQLKLKTHIKERIPALYLGVAIQNRLGVTVTTWCTKLEALAPRAPETMEFGLSIAPGLIAPGAYSFVAALFVPNGKVYHKVESICPVMLHDSGSDMAALSQYDYGVVIVPAKWSANRL